MKKDLQSSFSSRSIFGWLKKSLASKGCILLFILLLSVTWAGAQITVTNATFPVAGTTLRQAIASNPAIGIAVYTAPGGNQTWDLSGLQPGTLKNTLFRPATEGTQGGLVPEAELVTYSGAAETYYNVTSTRFETQAYYDNFYDVVAPYLAKNTPPIPERYAPLNFFDIYQSTMSMIAGSVCDIIPDPPGDPIIDCGFPISAFPGGNIAALPGNSVIDKLRYRIYIGRTEVVDAWGTMSIPGGTYNVLRMKRNQYREVRLEAHTFLGWLDITDNALQAGFQGLGVDTLITYHFFNDVEKEPIAVVTINNDEDAATQVIYKYNAPACTAPTVNAPTVTQPTCATATGTILVNASGSGTLEYSIDNGSTWQSSATFSGLSPGNYNIRVRNQSEPSCSTAYASNPVVLNAATGCGTLSINDVTHNEGNSGPTTYSFTVSLSSPAPAGGVTFDIATANNTATTANNDYVQKSLTGQTIPQGSSTYAFDVIVNGDNSIEPDETFFVNVTNVTGATISDGQGLGTITNDDINPCSCTDCRCTDSLELVKLYVATGGANWTHPWNLNQPMETWYTGDALLFPLIVNGRVTNVILENNNLNGTIPDLNLPKLKQLILSDHLLTGTIPDFNLPALQTLFINNSQVSGSIPAFNNLPELTQLALSVNQLTGSIPNFILPKLKSLQLAGNQLSGSIPNFNLPVLENLELDVNQLTGSIPNFNLPKLKYLHASSNQLTGSIPDFNLPALLSLNAVFNQLSGAVPAFSNLSVLFDLRLSNNQLSGTLPNFNLPSLFALDLSNNQLTGTIPDFNLPNLADLALVSNQLSGSIPGFSLLTKLEGLYLNQNQLTGTIPDFNLPRLRQLELSQNQLTGTIPNFNFPFLQGLRLSNNQLSSSIPAFNFPSLQSLLLNNNLLTGCIPGAIKTNSPFLQFGGDISNNPGLATQSWSDYWDNGGGVCPTCITNPVVINSNDAGSGSLRQAIIDACPNSIITFDMSTVTSPITLTTGQLVINKNLTIQGPGANLLKVQNAGFVQGEVRRVFFVGNVAASILDLTISGGYISGYGSGESNFDGAGIYNSGQLNITNCTISDNTVYGCSVCELFGDGGGILNTGTLTVTSSIIKNNLAGYGGDEGTANGAGIANKGGTVTITNSTISDNTAYSNGGGISNTGSLIITNSTFSNNYGGTGGGVFSYGTLTLKNSTISGNQGVNGAGIYYAGGPATITNCTVTGNVGYGGGIYNHTYELGGGSVPAGVFTISNSIVAGNSNNYDGSEGADYYFPWDSSIPPAGYANLTSLGYNFFGKVDAPHNWTFTGTGDQVGSYASPINPLLGPLANNGGPTFTHALLTGSPAIDKGSFVAGVTTDQRGETRPVDNSSIPNATNGDGSDIGAFEVQCSAPSFSVCPSNQNVNAANNLCSNVVNYTATATGTPDPTITYTFTGATTGTGNGTGSGSSFNVGVTTVILTATNNCGEPASCTFTVTVVDAQNPTITCPANITVNNDANQCGAVVTYAATATDNCPGTTIGYSPASGSFFPVGTTTVTATATDAVGHTASCTFTVTVVDAQNPSIICPANITQNNDAGQCGAVVTYAATANDNCPGATVQVMAGLPSGSVFPVGTSTVSLLAVEGTGNTAVYNFEKLNLGTIHGQDNWKVIGSGATPPSSTVNKVVNTSTSGAYTGSKAFFAADVGGNNRTFSSRVNDANFSLPTVTNTDIVVVEFDHLLAYWGDRLSFGFDINNDGDLDDANEHTFGYFEASNGGVLSLTGFNDATLASITGAASGIWKKIRLTANLSANGGAGSISFSYMDLTNNGPWVSPAGMQNINMGLNPAATNGQNAANINGMWLYHEAGEPSYLDNISFSARKTASCSFTVTVADAQPPTINCPANITVNNTSNQCGAVVNYTTPATATDNCPGTPTISYSPVSGSFFPVGTTTVTATATDVAGNSSSCTFTVTVLDVQNPSITCPANITRNMDPNQCGAVVSFAATASDNCPGVSIGYSPASGSLFPAGATTVTATATDAAGHTASCTFTVTVNPDTQAPVPPVIPNATGQCSVTPTAPVATDNCAGNVTGTTTTPFPITAQGTTVVTWTFDDGNGNVSTANQTVIVQDNIPPVTPVLPDVTGQCSATAPVPTTTDNCAGLVTGFTIDPLTYTTQGTHPIHWIFSDGHGNIIVVVQNVVVHDTQPPTAPASLNNVTAECSATPAAPTANDVCAGTITGTSNVAFPITTQGTTVVTWTFNDGNGNTSTVTQNVILDDVTPPPAPPSLPNVTAECSATPSAPEVIDNCAGKVTGTPNVTFPITTQGTTVVTWTFNDGNGNTSTVTQNVIIHDVTPPVPPTLSNITAQCSATPTAPTANDNCVGTVTGTTTTVFPVTTQGTTVVTWTFNDGNGNTSTATQNVIIHDVTPPVPPSSLPNILAQCSATAPAPVAQDNCAGPVTGTTTTVFPVTTQGVTVVTWTFNDGNGNTSTAVQNIFINDVTAPVPTLPSLPTIVDECGVTLTAPTAIDNCTGVITGTTFTPFPVTAQGTTVVTWIFNDGNGNISTQTQTVIVNDVTPPDAPNLPDIIAECSVTVTPPTTTDNCAGTVTGFTLDPLTYTAQGSYTITWVFSDGNGNVTLAKQNVVIDDITPPAAPLSLPDITAECSATPTAPIAIDNCVGTVIGTTTTVFPVTAQGTTVITWIFNDGNGNTSSVTQNVILHDVTPPTITCPAGITQAVSSGSRINNTEQEDGSNAHEGSGSNCSKYINTPNAVFNDNCGIPTLLTWTMGGATTAHSGSTGVNQVGGWTFNVGVTTVTYTITDGAGNTATCSFTVTVTEPVLPSISCPDDRKVNADNNKCYATNVILGNPTVSDNCGVASVTNNALSQYPVGVTYVTWTVTDISGNTRTCTQKVTVVDNQDPIINCPSNITINAGSNCQTTVTTPNPGYSDNCGVVSLTWCLSGATTGDSPSTGINFIGTRSFNIGVTTVTYTVKDASGRTNSCCFYVTVEDNQAPSLTCPANIAVSAGSSCSKRITVPNPTVSDNCSCVSLVWCMTGATTGSSSSYGINYVGSKTFNAGVTTISYAAEDAYGNTSYCSFTVTVTETVSPSITCPSNKTVYTNANACYATNVSLGTPKTSDNCGVASVTNNAPAQFPTGVTTVTWTVTDNSGNTKTCTQTVTVVDNQKPTLSCPADITICKVASNTYTIAPVTRTDNCGIASTTYQITGATTRSGTGTDASGLFNIGLSGIKWTVTDVNGNVTTCTTKVTVVTSGSCTNVRLITEAPKPEVKDVKEVKNGKLEIQVATKLEVTAWPNPTEYYFNIKVKSPDKETVEIRMYDMTGKLVQQERGAPEKTYRFGDHSVSGMYLIEVRQAGQIATIKVVKQ